MTEREASFAVATFHSTHAVMKAEKLLKEGGLAMVRLIPVPSQISSDCGVTVRFLRGDLDQARALLQPLDDDLEGMYVDSGSGWVSPQEVP